VNDNLARTFGVRLVVPTVSGAAAEAHIEAIASGGFCIRKRLVVGPFHTPNKFSKKTVVVRTNADVLPIDPMIVCRENTHQPFRVDEGFHESGIIAIVLTFSIGSITSICLVTNVFSINAGRNSVILFAQFPQFRCSFERDMNEGQARDYTVIRFVYLSLLDIEPIDRLKSQPERYVVRR
jgi:hypothetical protein